MKYLLIVSSFFIGSVALAQPGQFTVDALVSPKSSERIITVGGPGADVPGFTNKFIQFAIDAIASTGGTVKLTAGTFDILSPVHMRSNVDLEGTGPESILKKSDGVQTRFIIDADYGELKLTVENASGFLPGMRIQVTDNESSSCWNVSTALITEIIDDVIYIDSYLIRDYRADLNGLISNASSVIEIVNEENVTISNLTIDGNGQNNFLADGCNSAGILILKSKNATVDNVHVKDFNGEGISWQITENVTIRNSEIEGSGNMGLHPGTGSPLTIIENNKIHDNKVDGLFICWRVHHSLVRGNEFYNNGRFGICTGHKDTDVLFEKNHIHSNAADGVNLRGEREDNAPHRNTFRNNIIENNGTGQTGYGFSVNSIAKDLVLIDNIIRNNKKGALFIYSNGTAPAKMENNQISGHKINNIEFEARKK